MRLGRSGPDTGCIAIHTEMAVRCHLRDGHEGPHRSVCGLTSVQWAAPSTGSRGEVGELREQVAEIIDGCVMAYVHAHERLAGSPIGKVNEAAEQILALLAPSEPGEPKRLYHWCAYCGDLADRLRRQLAGVEESYREQCALSEALKRKIAEVEGERDRCRTALESIARIPTNMRDLGESWVQRMATHGSEARDAAREVLAAPTAEPSGPEGSEV